jgi:hypothetical protein
MRVESEHPIKGEFGGWLHELSRKEKLPPLPPPRKIEKKADWTEECRQMFDHEKAKDKRIAVARQLSVSVWSIRDLKVGVGWDDWNGAEFSSWPCRDEKMRIVGYTRRYDGGAKKTNEGGSVGVFCTVDWWKRPGPLFVVEGGSDVAACESYDLCAIGRGGNLHGAHIIRKLADRHAPEKKIIVVGERDESPNRRGQVASCPVDCSGCLYCFPGKYGAIKVAKELGADWALIPIGYKDMRELLAGDGLWLDLVRKF